MEKHHKRFMIFMIAFLVIAFLLWAWQRKNQAAINDVIDQPPSNEFSDPYSWPAGYVPGQTPAFQSTVNVYADNPLLSTLSYQYIPIFGMVGMTAVGG